MNENIYGLENLRCDERLHHLRLSRLESRRNRSDLIETFKTVNGHYNVNTNFTFDDVGRRGHSKMLFTRRSRLDAGKYVFANRVVERRNSISDCCINSTSVNLFKTHLSPTWNWKLA